MTVVAIGDLAEDIVVQMQTSIESPTSDTASKISRHRGGAASHIAVNVARLGGASRFVGVVGADSRGMELRRRVEAAGVDLAARTHGSTATLVVVVHPDGERHFFTDRGAASDLDALPSGALDGASWCYVGGYSLCSEPIGTMLRRELTPERRGDVRLLIDPSSVSVLEGFGVDRFGDVLDELSPDVIRGNAEEAALLGLHDGRSDGVMVISNGPAATTVIDGMQQVDVPFRSVARVIDSTGAGDAQSAGMLHALSKGASVVEAVVAGHDVAARVITAAGGDAWSEDVPWKDEPS